jgi:tetratricopeptide (TPR) repeat protein
LESMEMLSKTGTVVLLLEDLHWADSASIALLHFLARNIRARKILILGTYRPEDIHSNISGETHPLKESLRTMRREGACEELELRLLGPNETRGIVPLRLGGAAEEPLLDLVAEESKGNPLYAVEIINYLAVSGQVTSVDGVWRLHLKKLQTPSTVSEVILARTGPLPKQAKRVLESASAIGDWFEPHTLEEILEIPAGGVLEALELLDKEYYLIREDEGWYRFSHEKVRQVIYEGMSTLRRQELHRYIGFSLEKRLPNDELLGQLSWHFEKANEREKCIKYSLSAGRYCYQRKAIREAKSCFLKVLCRTEEDDGFTPDRLQALESLGDLKNDASSPLEWYSYYEQFLALNQDRRARARVLTKAAECLDQVGLADKRKAVELLDEAESISDGDPEVLANVEFMRADISHNDCDVDEALDHVTKAIHFFEETGDSIGILRCRELEVLILRQAYRLREAKVLAEKQLRAARDSGDPERLVMAGVLTAFICTMMGEAPSAKEYADETVKLADKLGMMWYLRLALMHRALVHELEGDLEAAIKDVTRALENALEMENPSQAVMCEIDLGMYEAEIGHQDKAELHYEASLIRSSAFDSWPRALLEADLSVLRAELLARAGAIQQSNEMYERTIERNKELGHPYEEMNCRSRYGLALARRGLCPEAQRQFDKAMDLAKKMGCERRVQIFAKWACVEI